MKTEVEILRDALISIAKNDVIWRDAVNECLRIAENARVKTFTIEEVEKFAIDLYMKGSLEESVSEFKERCKQKKKQLLSKEGGDE